MLNVPPEERGRQAANALRGYIYQIYQSLLAWIDLSPSETLYLEVAEDYAVVARDALTAVQVKDTASSGSITLSSKSVRVAIQSFWNFQLANPSKVVRFRYLTTSTIGTEKGLVFPDGQRGLLYWRNASRDNSDLEPLRGALANLDFSDDFLAFIRTGSGEDLRARLLGRISWDCGAEDITLLDHSIRDRLIYLGEPHSLLPSDSERARDALVAEVLTVITRTADRQLTRADLLRSFEKAVSVSIPISAVRQTMSQGFSQHTSALTSAFSPPASIVDKVSQLPLPPRIAERDALVKKLGADLGRTGALWFHGSSGLGKTVLAQLIARKAQDEWLRLDLRGSSSETTGYRLRAAAAVLACSDARGLILDDFPVEQESAARMRLAVLASEIRRSDASLIVTSARSPSWTLRDCLGSVAVTKVPYLTKEDVTELVRSAGGDAELWGNIIHTLCGFGHPQLVAARVSGLMHRNWPVSELLEGIDPTAGPMKDLDDERTPIRTRLLEELPGDARDLLYRLALMTLDFDRSLALEIAEVEPALPRPGELLDLLIGPWIEVRAEDRFRVSPLVSDAGVKTLPKGTQGSVHRSIVDQLLTRRPFPGQFLGHLLTHALISRHETGLAWLAGAVLCSGENQRAIAESLSVLPLLWVDKEEPIFPENAHVSAILRLAQFKVAATLDPTDQRLGAMVDRLIAEARALTPKDLSEMLVFMALGTVLIERSAAITSARWFPLLTEFQKLVEGDSETARFSRTLDTVKYGVRDWTLQQFFFAAQASALNSIEDLCGLFEQLDTLDAPHRDMYLSALQEPGTGASLMINSAWLAEHDRGCIDGTKAAAQFERLAGIARRWGHRDVAVELHCAQTVMLDEYAHNPGAALAALDGAERMYPREFRFARRRARIHYRNGDHERSLEALSLSDENLTWMGQVDRAFFLREAGISTAKTDKLAEASQLFERARQCATSAGDHMRWMAIGLLADRAVLGFMIGNREEAVNLMARALREAEGIDPEKGKKEKWCVAILAHTILWLRSQAQGQSWPGEPLAISFGCCSNPEPPEEIRNRATPPMLLNWYSLAAVEVDLEVDQGVLGELRDRTANGVFPGTELDLEHRIISRAIEHSDSELFLKSLPRYVSIGVHFSQHRETLHKEDLLHPSLCTIPIADRKDWPNNGGLSSAKDAVLAFAANALVMGRGGLFQELIKGLNSVDGIDSGLSPFLECFDERTAVHDDWLDAVAACIAPVADKSDPIAPENLFMATCYFWNWLSKSQFRAILERTLVDTLVAHWRSVVEKQQFALRRPIRTVPAIQAVLNSPKTGVAKLAEIALAAEDAVDRILSLEMRRLLDDSLSS